ncbi:MAG: ATP-dependent metallopeptidase FtsH/Yme1/Tma family protein, partial [Kineosporiaceae bacterium]
SAPAASSAPRPIGVTVTTLLSDAKAGNLRAARVDEQASSIVATARDARAPLSVEVPRTYLHDTVAALVQAGVPVGVADGSAGSGTAGSDTAGSGTAGSGAAGSDPAQAAKESPAHHSFKLSVIVPLVLLSLLLAFSAFYRALLVREKRRRAQRAADRPVLTRIEASSDDQPTAAAGPGSNKLTAPAETPDTRFSDVAGCDEAIDELTEMVAFLREPERFTRTGAKPPKGALLVGPPGTGKTLLARAVAGEAGVPFFVLAGSDFVEKYVGVGAQRIRDLFKAAREHGQAIIFIDEIDAVARRRSGDGEQGNGETENTLIALLAEMDGFTSSGVVVLAATNRADILDPAVTPPGRLDRKGEGANPDRRGRQRILEVHAAGKPLAADVDLVSVARRTPGFSGAQLAGLVNEACMEAARRTLDLVDQGCFDAAVATIAMGRARTSALVTEHDRRVTAWHEAGHTVAALLLPDADDPVQVTIVPRGPAGGVTWMSGNDDIFLPRRKAHAQLVVALAGRAAEEALLDGEYTQGASGDLQSATDLAYRMATQYGMTRLGYQVRHPQHAASNEAVSAVVEELLADAHKEATALLASHRALLAAVAEALLEEETLTAAQVRDLATAVAASAPETVAVALPAAVLLPDGSALPDDAVTVTGPVVDGFPPTRGRNRPRTSAASRLRALREQWERRTAPSATPGDAEPAGSVSG